MITGVAAISPEPIVRLNGAVVENPALSVTCTVNVAVPSVVGVPATTPALLNWRPLGHAPAVSAHVYGSVPFVASNVTAYADRSLPAGSEPAVAMPKKLAPVL